MLPLPKKDISNPKQIYRLELEIVSECGLDIYSRTSLQINILSPRNNLKETLIGYIPENAPIGQKILQIINQNSLLNYTYEIENKKYSKVY